MCATTGRIPTHPCLVTYCRDHSGSKPKDNIEVSGLRGCDHARPHLGRVLVTGAQLHVSLD
jgi:hypothetical protein